MKFIQKCEVILESMGEECILLPKIDGQYDLKRCVYLEGIGKEIWELAQSNSDTDIIVNYIIEKYRIDITSAKEDVEEIFHIFIEAGIIQEVI